MIKTIFLKPNGCRSNENKANLMRRISVEEDTDIFKSERERHVQYLSRRIRLPRGFPLRFAFEVLERITGPEVKIQSQL